MRDRVLVDYGAAAEPRERVRQEAGRLFLHRQYLPSEMRVEMPQSAHHSHLRLLQALSGTSRAATGSSTSGNAPPRVSLLFCFLIVMCLIEMNGHVADDPLSPIMIQSNPFLANCGESLLMERPQRCVI